ncbi:hypothetical protein CHU98_g6586 [Xylaria longipes]|nr:hypothetical protein CHU98_g6586 [Xylaria longipes]
MSAVPTQFMNTTQDVSHTSSQPVPEISHEEAASSNILDNRTRSPARSDVSAQWRGEGRANAVDSISMDDLDRQSTCWSAWLMSIPVVYTDGWHYPGRTMIL